MRRIVISLAVLFALCQAAGAQQRVNTATGVSTYPSTLGTQQWLTPFTVATLPLCATSSRGSTAYVTDAKSAYAVPLAGSGSVVVLAFCDGTNWIGLNAWNTGAPLVGPGISFTGTAPAITACGTIPSGSVDAKATANSGTVTAGGTATGCVITFHAAFATFDHCTVTPQSVLTGFSYSYTLSAITLVATALTGLIDYRCDGI